LSDLTFVHPIAALAALAGLVPIAVALQRLARERQVRRQLGLPEPSRRAVLVRPVLLACLFGLLALAAARPKLEVQHERRMRTDVQVVVALDSSRSMLATSARGQPERWQRARSFARTLRNELPSVPMGLSSFTNRLLPYLFPTGDVRAYDLVLDEAYGIERPPPALTLDRWVTVFDPLGQVTEGRFFSPDVHKRVLVVLSDAEARPFDAAALLRRLEGAGTTPVLVRFWRPGERIFRRDAESYRATQAGALAAFRGAGWAAFSEAQLHEAATSIRDAVGNGPLASIGYARRDIALAPWLALASLVPLLVLVLPGGYVPAPRTRRRRRRISGLLRRDAVTLGDRRRPVVSMRVERGGRA
jgi:hypothetical protein